jgi:hypothetical protein
MILMKTCNKILSLFLLITLTLGVSSCFDDLNTVPLDKDESTSATVYNDDDAYKAVLAKLYAGLSLSGQQGPAGQPDISGIDEGFSTYIRQYWKAQELTTDEAVIAWNDGNIHDFEEQDWDSQNEFITAMYNRIFYQISLCNEFLRETTVAKLDERGVSGNLRTEVEMFRAEGRFLRALSYWHALDMFRNPPFVTEEQAVGSFFPNQTNPLDLFNFIETELKEVENLMAAPKANEYGRADRAAAWALLAKMYLNAEAHGIGPKYSECLEYCNKLLNAGYELDDSYQHMFLADNDSSPEFIFAVNFDGQNTKTWGGMTFVVHAAVGGDMNPADFGIDGGWGGTRTTSAFVGKFPSVGGSVVVAPVEGQDYAKIYVPGSYQDWDPSNESTVLASTGDDLRYEGFIWLPADAQFKFTEGPNWDVNWGDGNKDGVLDMDNDNNITVSDAGYYKINVDLINKTYTLVKTEWGLIGDATPTGWDSDTDMTYVPETDSWTLSIDLVPGNIKFRANDGWDINYGDATGDAILDMDSNNDIPITQAGTYKVDLYLGIPDYTYGLEIPSFDSRAMFFTEGQTLEIEDVSQFTEGYAITKFKNIDQSGNAGSDLTFMDVDFPLFRLADVYLMYAEAILRGGSGGDFNTALNYLNELNERAYGDKSGNISEAEYTLEYILDERARELYWECHRRTDLIRFGQFSDGTYVWPLKGGTLEGQAVSSHFDVFPIPATDIGANPNLTQNTGY